MPRQKQSNPRGLKHQEDLKPLLRDGTVEKSKPDGSTEVIKSSSPEGKSRHRHSKTKSKYKSAMRVKIAEKVRKKRQAKALKEKQTKPMPEKQETLDVVKSTVEKVSSEISVEETKGRDSAAVPDVIFKDKYDMIKERRARMSRSSQDQGSMSPSKSAKESLTSSPKKQARQRHSSSSSQKTETTASVLRSSESEEEGLSKQQALEALLTITGEEFNSMNSMGGDQHVRNTPSVSSQGDAAIVTPRTPPILAGQKTNAPKSALTESHLMQYPHNSEVPERQSLKFRYSFPKGDNEEVVIRTESQRQHKHAHDSESSTDGVDSEGRLSRKPGKHVCQYCGRRCSKPSVLKKHIRSHTGERPYPCTPCGISFKTKSNLYKHCKSHSHAAKAVASGAELKPMEFDHDSASDETESDDETRDGEGEVDDATDEQNQLNSHSQTAQLLSSGNIRQTMTEADQEKLHSGRLTSLPESHPIFVPSSKSQASPVASQTGSVPWGMASELSQQRAKKQFLDTPSSLKSQHQPNNGGKLRSMESLEGVRGKSSVAEEEGTSVGGSSSSQSKSVSHGDIAGFQIDMETKHAVPVLSTHLTYSGGSTQPSQSAPITTVSSPNPCPPPSHQKAESSQSNVAKQDPSSQILIPLTNFNIVKSGGQYHFQIPLQGIPGLSEEVLKQGIHMNSDNNSSKEDDKSHPVLGLPSNQTKIQQHIQKLISQNEAIVDDSDLESVKPRRPSFSYRESMTNTLTQTPATNTDMLNESKSSSQSRAVAMETSRRSDVHEQTNSDSRQDVTGNQDRQREAQMLKKPQHAAHQHLGQLKQEPFRRVTEGGPGASHKLPTSLSAGLHQPVPREGNTIRNILLQHKLTQQGLPATSANMLGQSLPTDRQQYSPLWPHHAQVAPPWMLQEALQGGVRYPVASMYQHPPPMVQHLPADSLPPGWIPGPLHSRDDVHTKHQVDAGKTAQKRKKCKSESDALGSLSPHQSRKKSRGHHGNRPPHEGGMVMKAFPESSENMGHSTLPVFPSPFPGPDSNQAASQLLRLHASLPRGTSTPQRSPSIVPYSPKSSPRLSESGFPGVSVIQHTPTTPHPPTPGHHIPIPGQQTPIPGQHPSLPGPHPIPAQHPLTPGQLPATPGQHPPVMGQMKNDTKRETPVSSSWTKVQNIGPTHQSNTGNGRNKFSVASPFPYSPNQPSPSGGLLKVAPTQSSMLPQIPSSSPLPRPSMVQEKAKEEPIPEEMSADEALAKRKRSFTLALDEGSARASLQKRRNLPAIPGLNMTPGKAVPSRRTPGEQTQALDLTAKLRSLGSPLSSGTSRIPRLDLGGRSPVLTPTEGSKKFPKSPMKFGAAASRNQLSLDLHHPLTAAVKSASTPDGSKSSPKIDPRVLLSPEALSIAESVMKMAQSPMKAKTPSTPVDAARELGRLVAHAFHNAGGSIKSVLTTSDEGMIVGPIATPTPDGRKPQSQIFILPSPSSSHTPSFPSDSSPRDEKSPLTPVEKMSPGNEEDNKDKEESPAPVTVSPSVDHVKLPDCEKNIDQASSISLSGNKENTQPSKSVENFLAQTRVKSSPLCPSSQAESVVTDRLMKVLTPVLTPNTPHCMPRKIEKSLFDWFNMVKTNKAGKGPGTIPIFLYANISSRMKGVAQVTDCCTRRSQPMYAPQGSNRKLSMYSNWRPGGNTQHPLGVSWRDHLGMYNSSHNKHNISDVVCSISPPGSGILTHSSAWNLTAEKIKAVSEAMVVDTPSASCSSTSEPSQSSVQGACDEPDCKLEKPIRDKELKRIPIFEGGYKSNEEYVYVRGRGRGKYVCQECGIRCKKPSMLKKHIRTHTDLRPFQCNVCSFAFKTKGNLTKHMKSKAHTKKCLENGINPSDLEKEHGIDDSSSIVDDSEGHQFSDADENEDTDSADEDSEEDEMDDGMDEGMDTSESPHVIQERRNSCTDTQGDHSYRPEQRIKLKRSYSEILNKPPDLNGSKEDGLQPSKLSRSEVVCKLSQHLTNRQRALMHQDGSHPPLTKSQSLSHLPTTSQPFIPKKSRQHTQPPPVLDKYGHIVALQSYIPCSNQYRLATGSTSVTVTSSSQKPSQGRSSPLDTTSSTSYASSMTYRSSSTAIGSSGTLEEKLPQNSVSRHLWSLPSSTSSKVHPVSDVSSSTAGTGLLWGLGKPMAMNEKLGIVNSDSHLKAASLSTTGSSVTSASHRSYTEPKSVVNMPDKSDGRQHFVASSMSPGASVNLLPPPIIEPVSDDDEESGNRKTRTDVPSTSHVHSLPTTPRSSVELSGNAIKQLLLSRPPIWPSLPDKSPTQPSASPFLPPSPSLLNVASPSPTHMKAFSPLPYNRLVSPIHPSKMFQLPPTILPMHLSPVPLGFRTGAPPDGHAVASAAKHEGEQRDVTTSPPSSSASCTTHSKDKVGGELLREEQKPKGSEEDRSALSPNSNVGHHRCSHCGEMFVKPSQLRIHARIHTVETSFTCHECSLTFVTKNLLSKHERSEEHLSRVEAVELATTTGMDSNPRPFKCKECAIAFRIPGHLAKHLRSRGHLMTLERQGKLPLHKQELLYLNAEGGEDLAGTGGDTKTPGSPASSEKTDSASEGEEGDKVS